MTLGLCGEPASAASPVDLSAAGQDAIGPQVAAAADGSAMVTWYRNDGSNRRVQARRIAADGTLGSVLDLSAAGRDAVSPQVAIAADGSATFTWVRSDGSNFRVQSRRIAADGTLGSVLDLSAAGQNAESSQVAVAADGTATISWSTVGDQVWARRVATDGTLGSVLDLSAGQAGFSPQVAVAADGSATVTWVGSDGSNKRIQGRRIAADGTLGSVLDLSAAGTNALEPQIAVGADGIATVIWYRDFGDFNLRVQMVRIAADGTPGSVVDLIGPVGAAAEQQIAAAADGSATVTWHRLDGTHRVQAIRIAPDGTPRLAVDLSAPGGNYTHDPQVAVAPDGSATVTWHWFDGSNFRVQARRIAADFAPPSSSASAPATSASSAFAVGYAAADTGAAGLDKVELYVKRPGDSAYSLAATDATPSQSGESFSYNADAGDGDYAFYTLAYDASGNVEGTPGNVDATTTLDTGAPIPTLTTPPDDALTNDNSPAFSGVGATAGSDRATVTVKIWSGATVGGGDPDYTVDATRDASTGAYSSSGPYTRVSDASSVATLPDGTYTARAFQSDSATNIGQSTQAPTFTVDAQDPIVDCAAADSAWHNQNVALACTASDTGSGLADSADASFSLSTTVADGEESSNAATESNEICDHAGNCATAGPLSGNKVDRTRPSTSDNVPTGPVNQNATVTLSASDTGSGVDKTHYTKGASPPDPTTASAVYSAGAKPVLGNGERIKYFSTDNAGNQESVKTSPVAQVVVPPSRPANTSPPRLPASGRVGERVTCNRGAWTGAPSSFGFSWTIDTSLIAGQHGSAYTLAAGDATHAIRCQVVARNVAGDSAPATSNALTVAKPPSSCKDTVAPTSTIEIERSALEQGKLRLKGKAADKPCKDKPGRVVSVTVTISRHVTKGCRFLLEDGRSFGPKRKCDGKPPIIFRAKGTKEWSLKMPADLPAGKYTMRARATDAAGNVQPVRREGPNVLSLRVR